MKHNPNINIALHGDPFYYLFQEYKDKYLLNIKIDLDELYFYSIETDHKEMERIIKCLIDDRIEDV